LQPSPRPSRSAGCAAFPAAPARASARESHESRQVVELIGYTQKVAALQAEEQQRELNASNQIFAKDRGAYGRVRLALLLALPGTAFNDDARAAGLLESLAGASESPQGPIQQFAGLLPRGRSASAARAAPHGPTEGATRSAEGGRTQDHRTGAGAAKMSTILLVDDDPDILKLISLRLTAAGHSVKGARAREGAGHARGVAPRARHHRLKMGGIDGLTLFDEIRKQAPTLPVIILTAHGTIPDAVAATRRGVFGFQPKPFDGKHLLDQVEQALRLSGVGQGGDDGDWRRGLVTQSPKMENVLHQARLVAQSEASVFIQGASGTGKELLARAIHRASRRSEGPFVAVNCAAIPENLLESELFGHRKGSFTGAIYDHKGLSPQQTEGRCSWMRSAICLLLCKPSSCGTAGPRGACGRCNSRDGGGRTDHLPRRIVTSTSR